MIHVYVFTLFMMLAIAILQCAILNKMKSFIDMLRKHEKSLLKMQGDFSKLFQSINEVKQTDNTEALIRTEEKQTERSIQKQAGITIQQNTVKLPEKSWKNNLHSFNEELEFFKLEKYKEGFDWNSRIAQRIWNWICVGEELRPTNISAEYAVVTTWLIRIGIITLLAGLGFLMKYSIDKNLLNPLVRMSSMFVAGIAMTGCGLLFSKGKYRSLFIALTGAGFTVLYLNIAASLKLYHLIGNATALILSVLVTVAAMLISLKMNSLLPALLGCVGGYIAPVFISSGSGNTVAFLGYMTILSAGTLLIARYRNWQILQIAAQFFYTGLAWIAYEKSAAADFIPLLALFSLNYLIFNLPAVIRSKENRLTTVIDVALLSLNILFYLLTMIHDQKAVSCNAIKLNAMIALFAALVPLAEWFWIRMKQKKEKILQEILLLQSGFGIMIMLPLLLKGEWLIATESVTACMYIFFASRTNSKVLCLPGIYLFYSSITMLAAHYITGTAKDIFLSRQAIALILVLMLTGAGIACQQWQKKVTLKVEIQIAKHLSVLAFLTAGLLFFLFSSIELDHILKLLLPSFRHGGLTVWWSLLAVILVYSGIRFKIQELRYPGAFLFPVCATKIFFLDLAGHDPFWRIIAMIACGLLMLAGAIFYIRFKDQFMTGNGGRSEKEEQVSEKNG
ncbi:MAG: DUF2339 domain-containing protein [Lentisphaeria bacterium]|nr:DUF2339 domain-containing protein [Lentisphaeria bacterium]